MKKSDFANSLTHFTLCEICTPFLCTYIPFQGFKVSEFNSSRLFTFMLHNTFSTFSCALLLATSCLLLTCFLKKVHTQLMQIPFYQVKKLNPEFLFTKVLYSQKSKMLCQSQTPDSDPDVLSDPDPGSQNKR